MRFRIDKNSSFISQLPDAQPGTYSVCTWADPASGEATYAERPCYYVEVDDLTQLLGILDRTEAIVIYKDNQTQEYELGEPDYY
jgi:hypothetical protein